MSRSQVNIFIIFITFHLENFNANVALMMKMWGIATSNQGGRGLASFVGTIYIEFLFEIGDVSVRGDTVRYWKSANNNAGTTAGGSMPLSIVNSVSIAT